MECLDEEQRDMLRNVYPGMNLEGLRTSDLLDLLPDPVPHNYHTLVAPLTEIISIGIKFNVNHDAQHKIYGTIQITDGEGNTFVFYNREDDNPENIANGGTLTLTFPKNNIIIPSNVAEVDVNLKDGDNNVEIVKGIFKWNCTTKAGYNERNVVEFKGKGGSVVLDYLTMSHAVIARVDMMLERRRDDSESSNVKMYGEITARYAGNLSCVLFDKKQAESVTQEYGSFFELSRHVFIVPATLTSLEIFVKLFDGETRQQIVEGKVEYKVFIFPLSRCRVEGQSCILDAQFSRSHTYMQRPVGRRVERANHFLEQRPSSTMRINRNLSSPYGEKLYEIYSVSIGGVNDEDINLSGSINVLYDYPRSRLSLFNKDKVSSHRLLPYHTVPLSSYTDCLTGSTFYINTRLRDADGRLISSGYIGWLEKSCREYWSLFNRQLCSIIRGSDGCYAAIHYSMFDAGVQAMVQIYLNKETSATKNVKIEGSIFSQYSCYDYSTWYNKTYYRRPLFARKSTEPWIHCPDSSFMLSESSVMVPMGSSLILDVDLEVTLKGSNLNNDDDDVDISDCVSPFKQLLEFEVDMSNLTNRETMMKTIEGSSLLISAHVEWRPYYYYQ